MRVTCSFPALQVSCRLQMQEFASPSDGGAYCTVEVVLDGFYYLSRHLCLPLAFFFLFGIMLGCRRESYIYFVGGQDFLVLGNNNLG